MSGKLPGREESLEILDLMYLVRLFEEQAKDLHRRKLLEGSFMGALHTCVGQEACAVGACRALGRDDFVFSTHRGHGHFIARGGDLGRMMAELRGKETGCSGGCGGSMHLFDPEKGFMGGNGIVGAGLPLAVGAAYSARYRRSGQVTLCFFGDGAASQGTFHESLNIASLWNLPVVFACENNCYAVTSCCTRTISVPDIASRAAGYGMPGEVVDGNDVVEVMEKARAAVARARAGKGPSLLEFKTYRRDPHCMVIPETRPAEEIAGWEMKDPIVLFEARLEKAGLAGPEDFAEARRRAAGAIEQADRFARESPFPDPGAFREKVEKRDA